MLVRHAKKGNGNPIDEDEMNGGSKNLLSRIGEIASNSLKLPKCMSNVVRVGGSEFSRSVMTAIRIANGNGFDPLIIGSNPYLASQSDFAWFNANWGRVKEEMAQNGGVEISACRKLMSSEMIANIEKGLTMTIAEYVLWKGDIILGTHSPWIQFAIEMLTKEPVNYDVAELGYIVIAEPATIVATNIPELCIKV